MIAELRYVTQFIMILMLIGYFEYPAHSTTIMYSFRCESNDAKSTLTDDSYLSGIKEEYNEKALNYQIQSFNYLHEGKIRFMDLISCHNVFNEAKRDFRSTNISFEGREWISNFYSAGYFSDGREISLKNSIGFKNSRGNNSINSFKEFYASKNNNITKKMYLDADIIIKNNKKNNISFKFEYNLSAFEGEAEISNTLRSADNPGEDGINWEQFAWMKGNISAKNDLLLFN